MGHRQQSASADPPLANSGRARHDSRRRLANDGGFNHNLYGLRRVDELEERYPEFPGLNLTYELREAFVRHELVRTAEAEAAVAALSERGTDVVEVSAAAFAASVS